METVKKAENYSLTNRVSEEGVEEVWHSCGGCQFDAYLQEKVRYIH